MRIRLTAISDTHAGSTTGLAPKTGIAHPEGITISASPTSAWLWDLYTQHLEAEAAAAKDHDARALVFVGDIMDGGMHHGNVQLYHPHASVEKWISEKVVDHAVDILAPEYIFVVLGTPSHVGKGSASEESVGKALAAQHGAKLQRPDEHRYGWGVLRMELAGVPFDIRHHGKTGNLPHTRRSYAARFAEDIWSSQAMYGNEIGSQWVAIRAHKHKYNDTGQPPPHRKGVRLFSMPCYQMSTEWARSRSFEEQPDIGMLGLTCEGGRLRDVFPQVVCPQPMEPVWTP